MYAVLNPDNTISDFEIRDIPLEELVHPDFHCFYIEIEEIGTLKKGDIWHPDSRSWDSVPIIGQPEPTPEPEQKEYQPTNAEIAQAISDLQADLIIAGVI